MADWSRPNPEHLLAQVQAEERHRGRGRLKVFLGYAAGVGKTFAMLSSARERLAEGVEVVVGYVETHGRAETEALVVGLEVVPRRRTEYRGTELTEMDLDAVLARRPRVVLVDELAHTNAPGSRHVKRFQDVMELLEAGMDVYTTVNIQHLESLTDVVAQITGVTVRETVPDGVLEEADEIETVDLPPDELLLRLRDGKVYVAEQAQRAMELFFRKGNLTALREMTLRRVARRVDDQMRAYMQMRSIPGPWPAGERLAVCVSPSPSSERLVRGTKRLADDLGAEWFAVYIETPNQPALSREDEERLANHLRLAEGLGARTARLPSPNVAEGTVKFAEDHNVTKIIVGKPLHSRWLQLLRGSVVEEIVRRSGRIDVYFVSGTAGQATRATHLPVGATKQWRQYLLSVGLVVLATVVSWPFQYGLHPTNLVMIYLGTVVGAALYLGRGPALLASVLGVMAFDFFFVEPKLSLSVNDTQYIVTFAGLLVVGLVISTLASRVRNQVDAGRRREAETAGLYALSRDLAAAAELPAILQAALAHIRESFGKNAVLLLPEAGVLRAVAGTYPGPLSENELGVAMWVFQQNRPAGAGTSTLPGSELHYIPLRTHGGVVGVLAVEPLTPWTPQGGRSLEAVANQVALVVERTQLAEEAGHVEVLRATERVQAALLSSVSHQLRTPLASVTGVLSALRAGGEGQASALPEAAQTELLDTAWEQVQHLNWLVGNLLDMTRLDAGAVRLNLEPCDLQDAVGVSLAQMSSRTRGREVRVDLPPDLPLVPMDFVLVVQVINNLLDNALRYSPNEASVEITARRLTDPGAALEVSVRDHGPGLAPEDLPRVFDRFRRARGPEAGGGAGLGLSICQAVIELHGGRIRAQNDPEGGARFLFTLPLGPEAPPAGEAGP